MQGVGKLLLRQLFFLAQSADQFPCFFKIHFERPFFAARCSGRVFSIIALGEEINQRSVEFVAVLLPGLVVK